MMNTIRKWIRAVFGFSGREINGFIILLPLMVILIMAQPLYHLWITNRTQDFSHESKVLDSLMTLWDVEVPAKEEDNPSLSLFYFDPNKVSVKKLQALGFSEILSSRIANYRQKGGQFRIKSDLLKIYGLDSSFYRQLYTYILLPEKKAFGSKEQNYARKEEKKELVVSFDLNTADTTQLKSVYGIGPVLASRIVRFRDALGGFIRPGQLNEVYGLDSAVVNGLFKVAFIAHDFVPKKINMNVASEKEFSAHPYIKRTMANAIVSYRFQHGKFTDVEDLRKLNLLKQAEIDKLLPYLKLND